MPQHKSAIKRVRQNKVRNLRNRAQRSQMRTLMKSALATTDKQTGEEVYKKAVAYLDRLSTRGLIHKKNAAHKKSRLTKHFNSLA